MTQSAPRMLAVVRCGDKSVHESWAVGERSFDVAVSYFGDDASRDFPEAQYVHRYKGGKWDGLFAFFEAFPDLAQSYDYFWFPDDDVVSKAADVDRLIRIGENYGLDYFQPALDRKSYFSHLMTLHHSSFMLRYSNFVEIMIPVLSKRLLAQALPTMANTKSGFGLDFVWAEMANALGAGDSFNVAIVDAVCVQHTRPVGGALHQLMKKSGGPVAADELKGTAETIAAPAHSQIAGVPVPRIRIIRGITKRGKLVSGRGAMPSIFVDLAIRGRNTVQEPTLSSVIRHALKAGLISDVDRDRRPQHV